MATRKAVLGATTLCPTASSEQSTADVEKRKVLHLFVSEDEKANHRKFTEIFVGKDRTETLPVPGSTTNQTFEQATDLARLSTLELISFVFVVHHAGFSFGGKISSGDLMMTYTGNIRGELDNWMLLEVLTEEIQKLDAACIATMVRSCIFSGIPNPPLDIADLLVLLDNFKPDLVEAVLQHPSLKKEADVLSQFGQLYMELLQVKETDEAMYNRITARIPYCELDADHWKLRANANDFLRGILTYNNKKVKKPVLSDDDVIQVHRALLAEPALAPLLDQSIQADVALRITLLTGARIAGAPPSVTDRDTFFRVVLDSLKANYGHGGGHFVRNVRNDDQHLIEGQSTKKVSTSTGATTTNPATITPQATTATTTSMGTIPQATTPMANTAATTSQTAQSTAIILFRYYQLKYIFGGCFPQFFCKFFMAMYEEGLVQKSFDRTLTHLMLKS